MKILLLKLKYALKGKNPEMEYIESRSITKYMLATGSISRVK